VNDTGRPLPDFPWQQDPRVRLITTNRRERCHARNTGAAIALGDYLHFLDDDDWLLPGAIQTFWYLTRQHPEAAWLCGSSQIVSRQGKPLLQLHHSLDGNSFVKVMAGEWIPLQSSLIAAKAFFLVGGFSPLVLATQDVDLCRRINLHGPLAETQTLVAGISMGRQGSSTDRARSPEYSRQAREKILDEPGVFTRMRESANEATWHGRLVRIYLTSAVWNLKRKRLFTALSRVSHAMMGLLLAGSYLFSPHLWRATANPYKSDAFERGWEVTREQV
jgi:glycosyltransferase involved in cell wall biosynthesis